jgi:hypothetical protein
MSFRILWFRKYPATITGGFTITANSVLNELSILPSGRLSRYAKEGILQLSKNMWAENFEASIAYTDHSRFIPSVNAVFQCPAYRRCAGFLNFSYFLEGVLKHPGLTVYSDGTAGAARTAGPPVRPPTNRQRNLNGFTVLSRQALER